MYLLKRAICFSSKDREMPMSENITKKPLSSRLERIYRLLCEENDPLPANSLLPSVRKVKIRFALGQEAATSVCEHLAGRYGVEMKPKKRTRKAGAGGALTKENFEFGRDTVLLLASESAPTWNPVVEEFNATRKHRIAVRYLPTYYDLHYAIHNSGFDFCLNINNPIMSGIIADTFPFIDLSSMLTELDHSLYYPNLSVVDHAGRVWGIAPNQIVRAFCCNQAVFKTPVRNYTWDEFFELLSEIRRKAPSDMRFPFLCSHYCDFLLARGGRFLDPLTLRCKPSPSLKTALDSFKELIRAGFAPLVSDIYPNRDDLRLFYGNRAAIKMFNMPLLPVDRNYRFLPFPKEPGQHTVANYEFFSIRSDSMNYRGAWEFIKFALSAKGQRIMALSSRTVPVMRGIMPSFLRKNEFRLFSECFENAITIPENTYFCQANRDIADAATDRYLRFGGDYARWLEELGKSFLAAKRKEFEGKETI